MLDYNLPLDACLKRWKILVECTNSVNKSLINNVIDDNFLQTSMSFIDFLSTNLGKNNSIYLNYIDLDVQLQNNVTLNVNEQNKFKVNLLTGYAFFESIIRTILKFLQLKIFENHSNHLERTIIDFLKFIRLNDNYFYNYILKEFFDFLILLNKLYFSFENNEQNILSDIDQFKNYILELKKLKYQVYNLTYIEVNLDNENVVKNYYIQLMKILTKLIEPVNDFSIIKSSYFKLIDLNLSSSCPEMDVALINFSINKISFTTLQNNYYEKYFFFICSITNRYIFNENNKIFTNDLLENLWDSYSNYFQFIYDEEELLKILFYSVDNLLNLIKELKKIKNFYFIEIIFPKTVIKFYKNLENQSSLEIYLHKNIYQILDFYLYKYSENLLQSDEWCNLIKNLLIKDYYLLKKNLNNLNSMNFNNEVLLNSKNSFINKNYIEKYLDFLNKNLKINDLSNIFIKLINISNVILPCLSFLKLKENVLNSNFDLDIFKNLLILFSGNFEQNNKVNLEIENFYEQIYCFFNNYLTLTIQLGHELSSEYFLILFLPWKDTRLIYIQQNQKLIDNLIPECFKETAKIRQVCSKTIVKFPIKKMCLYQIDFYNFILKNEFYGMENEIKSSFVLYMYIANNENQSMFVDWYKFIVNKKDKVFLSTILGDISCLIFNNCELVFDTINNNDITIDLKLYCNTCIKNDYQDDVKNKSFKLKSLVKNDFIKCLDISENELGLEFLIDNSSIQFFNHFDLDDEISQKIFTFFNSTNPKIKKCLKKLLNNIFNSLKTEKENFFEKFEIFISSLNVSGIDLARKYALFENIALMCKYFPKHQLKIIIYLLKNSMKGNSNLINFTSIILEKTIFDNNDNSKTKYFIDNKNYICEKILEILLKENVEAELLFQWLKNSLSIFSSLPEVFDKLFISSFHFILPYLIKNRTEKSQSLLEFMLKNLQFTTLEQLFLQFFDSLILFFARKMNIDEINDSLNYLKVTVKVDIEKLFSKKSTIVYILLYEYYNQPKSTNYLLSLLNKEENDTDFIDFNVSSSSLINFLNDKMGGYLLNLNTQFIRNKDTAFKTLLLRSLRQILSFLKNEKTISNYFEKLMSVLRSAFNYQSKEDDGFKDFFIHLEEVWKTLILNCNKDDLAKHLSLICKNLMDLLKVENNNVYNLFKALIVDNESKLGNSLKQIHFLPKIKMTMDNVQEVVNKYIILMPENGEEKNFKNYLENLEDCLKIENPEIKYFHYEKLIAVFRKNEKCLRSFCNSGNDRTVKPIINQLLFKMFADSKMVDEKLRSIIGECLGEIGAIDPGRLEEFQCNSFKEETEFFYGSIKESEFGILLINKLVAYFDLISDSKLQDCINFSLQEILKFYKVKKGDNKIWSKIQPRCQSVCEQLFNSRFVLDEKINPFSHPVYEKNKNFHDWITKWSISLIYMIKDPFSKNVLVSLCPLIRYCPSLAEFILPLIIIVILINGSETEKNLVFQEIDFFMQSCLPTNIDSQNENFTKKSIPILFEAKSEQYQCAHALFTLLDFLYNWCEKSKNLLSIKDKNHLKKTFNIDKHALDSRFKEVSSFLKKISKARLSELASSCQSYDRSLMYLEEYIYNNKNELNQNFDNLQKIYVALNEPDGVDGVIACRKEEPSLFNSILSHEVNGELQEAISCCEKANKLYPNELVYSKIYLRCLLLLGHEKTAKIFATYSIQQQENFINDLQPFIVEAAWKMSDWKNLEKELSQINNLEPNFEVGIGNLLMCIRKNDINSFNLKINEIRLSEVNQISISLIENRAYGKNYPSLVKLHMLNDIEYFFKQWNFSKTKQNLVTSIFERFNDRTKVIQTSFRLKEPLVNLQRVLLNMRWTMSNSNYQSQLAQLWLESSKLARKSKNFQSAYNCLLEIQILEQQNAVFEKTLREKIIIEKAKYHWQKETLEDKEKAIKELYRGTKLFCLENEISNKKSEVDFTCAKLHLLYNIYSEKTFNLDSSTLRKNFLNITLKYNEWEQSYYNLAMFYDRLAKNEDSLAQKAELFKEIIKNFGESLRYGSKHVYESMPKLLTAWFDLGNLVINAKSNDRMKLESFCSSATECVRNFTEKLEPYNFYTAVSQLASRMCHPLNEISDQITDILAKLISIYPHQTLWLLLSCFLSENELRKKKMNNMMKKFVSNKELILCYIKLGNYLCRICKHETKVNSFNLTETFPEFKKEFIAFSNKKLILLVPFQCFMNVQFANSKNDNLVFIKSFEDKVTILRSLVKPKKITIKGTDGKNYVMMCKPKDDLRKDCRAMEFNNLINRYLKKDSETRKRNLFIKTYTVVPLRHDCGLIEWINNLEGYRQTLLGTYIKEIENFECSNSSIVAAYPKPACDLEESLKKFENKVLPMFPTIFHKWFLLQFQSPTTWYDAKLNYVRSCAVMSIVGYIIGLGDRHGENILINLKTGNLVHVDFNCIFNKGEELEVPEIVPFRLTHNMVDAMGPTGYEGVFRKTCESTLKVMREQKEALMSVLTTFVYDPLIEWDNKKPRGRAKQSISKGENHEVSKDIALNNLNKINDRLSGIIRSEKNKNKIPISVNYQVSHLINEATDLKNLCKMYIGWASYL